MLTSPSKDNIAFEVIAPSLPGFGFSDGAAKKGLCPEKISVIMRNLMMRIGLEKFYIQGGDWVTKSPEISKKKFDRRSHFRAASSEVI